MKTPLARKDVGRERRCDGIKSLVARKWHYVFRCSPGACLPLCLWRQRFREGDQQPNRDGEHPRRDCGMHNSLFVRCLGMLEPCVTAKQALQGWMMVTWGRILCIALFNGGVLAVALLITRRGGAEPSSR